MKHIMGVLIAILLTTILLYLSRFWIWQGPWANEGLFALKALSPRGDVIRQTVRGTPLGPFDLLIWFGLAIVALSGLQRLYSRVIK